MWFSALATVISAASGGSRRSSRLAQYSPPNPPPTTTTRGRPSPAMTAGYPPGQAVHRTPAASKDNDTKLADRRPSGGDGGRASGPATSPSSSGRRSGGAVVADAPRRLGGSPRVADAVRIRRKDSLAGTGVDLLSLSG